MSIETAPPSTDTTPVVEGDPITEQHGADDAQPEQQDAQDGSEDKPAKPEKTPEQREQEKTLRRISRLVERREQALAENRHLKAELERLRGTGRQPEAGGDTIESDDDVVRIPRAELPRVLEQHRTEAEQRARLTKAARQLQADLGADFDAVSQELSDTLGADLALAVLDAEQPAALARYLSDPDNADEAEAMRGMSPVQAGRAMARIEAKIAAQASKPQPSKAAAPLTKTRPTSGGDSAAPTDMAAYMAWANKRYSR